MEKFLGTRKLEREAIVRGYSKASQNILVVSGGGVLS